MPRGFSLVELIIVTAIIALISAVVFANFPSFRGLLALDQEAGKLALSLRKVQSFAIAVRKFQDVAVPQGSCAAAFESNFPAYGVSLEKTLSDYLIYADPNCTKTYEDAFIPAEKIETVNLEGKIKIKDICPNIDTPPVICNLDKIDILYVRPGPKLVLTGFAGAVASNPTSVKIVLSTQDDAAQKSIVVRTTGQISVEQ